MLLGTWPSLPGRVVVVMAACFTIDKGSWSVISKTTNIIMVGRLASETCRQTGSLGESLVSDLPWFPLLVNKI